MQTITCFSYKGGAGRSTSAANVAAELAKRGKQVAVVDADLGAPGLHYLFGVNAISDDPDYVGTHHLLNDMVRIDDIIDKSLIDIGKKHDDGRAWDFEEKGGKLMLLASSPNHIPPLEPDDYASRLAKTCLGVLRSRLDDLGYDYLIIDSASGIGPAAGVCMDNSDTVLVFFRWTRQHVLGTAECVSELLQTDRSGIRSLRTVATSVPRDDELEIISDMVLMKSLMISRSEYEQILQGVGDDGALPVAQIPEYIPFKWSERVVVFDTDLFAPLADFLEQEQDGASA